MQDLDIRYAFIIMPIIYMLIPYFLVFDFTFVAIIGLTTIATSIAVIWALTSLNIVESGINPEGTYLAFVLVTGLLFYGFSIILNFLSNTTLNGFFSHGLLGSNHHNSGGIDINQNDLIFKSPMAIVYPSSIHIFGISFFDTLTAIMGIVLILGLYFMISTRGH
jgi:hypothetical protein